MSGYEIYRLAFKVLGVFALIKALEITQIFVLMMEPIGEGHRLLYFLQGITPFILLLLASVILWVYADSFAKSLSTDSNYSEKSEINSKEIQVALFSAIGIYLLVTTLPSLAQIVSSNYIFNTQEYVPEYMKATNWAEIIKHLAQIMLGVWLLLGSQGIVSLLNTLKNAGVREKV